MREPEIETPDDLIVRKCAEFAQRIILTDKRRNREHLAALVFNSLMHMRSKGNEAAGAFLPPIETETREGALE